ncbi:cobalt-precorrin-6A reductase [Acetobacter cerevisiae]|uniref:Cobalt-precorrin-6X reductase n=1 Tax=Acetobacter cerevisiae TaxID=178900 RepID=A0A149Q482_9PROT|nr:cobalt-precorrin-6A reductase [Acetobacter cerevisiae]KXU92013.1 cobalt-precorrin-6X reductase [Acetobacter cerevisiae]GBQ08028.1 precorrin 6x reductase [Acetobacter cerevisiae DSM 14362]
MPFSAASAPVPVLILGGTTEASRVCRLLEHHPAFTPTLSLAGVTKNPHLPNIAVRIDGFGGVEGLKDWLNQHAIQAVIDATHPFAATMSQHVAAACAELALPVLRLERPAWLPTPQDHWYSVPNLTAAASLLADPAGFGQRPLRVFLTTGRKEVAPFCAAPQHTYLLRSIDAPDPASLPPHTTCLSARGPFDYAAELAVMQAHHIDILVTKNSGGNATFPKLEAARSLHCPVIMVERPPHPACPRVDTPEEAMVWLQTHQTASTLRDV